jgi:hypothetical protein
MESDKNTGRLLGGHQAHPQRQAPGSKLVKQGLCRFNQEKRQAMGKELSRLLASLKKSSTPTG